MPKSLVTMFKNYVLRFLGVNTWLGVFGVEMERKVMGQQCLGFTTSGKKLIFLASHACSWHALKTFKKKKLPLFQQCCVNYLYLSSKGQQIRAGLFNSGTRHTPVPNGSEGA